MESKRFTGHALLAGLSVGWLVGLSVSPVIDGVIASLLSLAILLVTIASGLGDGPEKPYYLRIDPKPVAVLLASIALASTLGALVRVNGLLGPYRAHAQQMSGAGLNAAEGTGKRMRSDDLLPLTTQDLQTLEYHFAELKAIASKGDGRLVAEDLTKFMSAVGSALMSVREHEQLTSLRSQQARGPSEDEQLAYLEAKRALRETLIYKWSE